MANPSTQTEAITNVSAVQAIPLALQHVVAMIVGCVTVPIIVSSAAGLSSSDSVLMMQSSIICAGVAILIQSWGFKGYIGAKLPYIIGSGFAFISTMTVIAGTEGVSYVFGATFIGSLVGIVFGLFYKQLHFLFAPVVKAAVVITIGISLYKVAVGYMAGGTSSAIYGSPQAWAIALFTMIATLIYNNWGRGILRTASLLFGLFTGYIAAVICGMVNFESIATTPIFQFIEPFHFGWSFSLSAVLPMCVVSAISSVEAVGQMEALTMGAFNRNTSPKEVRGGIIGINLGGLLGSFIGGVPTASAGQNVGIVTANHVTARKVFITAGCIVVLIGLFPKLASVFYTIPLPVLGGATVAVFGSLAMTGMKIAVADGLTPRNLTILGLSLALAVGVSFLNDPFSGFPTWVETIFGHDVIVATLMSIILNLVLPGRPTYAPHAESAAPAAKEIPAPAASSAAAVSSPAEATPLPESSAVCAAQIAQSVQHTGGVQSASGVQNGPANR